MAILALAAFRIYRLLAKDIILDRPRAWLIQLPRDWTEGDAIPEGFKEKWSTFLVCPWCLGFHVCWVLWLCWAWQPHITLVLCTPLVLSAAVGLIAKLDTDED
jgi:hypothetical protein